jgi:hypothetical protein
MDDATSLLFDLPGFLSLSVPNTPSAVVDQLGVDP